MRHLTKEHGRIIEKFFNYPKGFVREWYRPVAHGAFLTQHNKWFYDPNDVDGPTDFALETLACEDLAAEGIIVPTMDDIEWRAQIAVGSIQYRIYKFNEDFRGILKKEFIDYLDEAPILWL